MSEQQTEAINSVSINTGADLIFMNVSLKIVYEHEKACSKILVILPDGAEPEGEPRNLGQFIAGISSLFTDLQINGSEEIHSRINEVLAGAGFVTQSGRDVADTADVGGINVELKQFFLYITKSADGNVDVEYAFGLRLSFNDEHERHGLFKMFELGSIFLNVWNVSTSSKIYRKMGIQTIEDLLR